MSNKTLSSVVWNEYVTDSANYEVLRSNVSNFQLLYDHPADSVREDKIEGELLDVLEELSLARSRHNEFNNQVDLYLPELTERYESVKDIFSEIERCQKDQTEDTESWQEAYAETIPESDDSSEN